MSSATASLTRWAPRLPPKERRQTFPSGTLQSRRASSRRAVRISGRTGLPVTTHFPLASWGRYSSALATARRTLSTRLASSLVVTPGKAFCSWVAVGMPIFAATRRMGPLTYPPVPTTRSGAKARMTLLARLSAVTRRKADFTLR